MVYFQGITLNEIREKNKYHVISLWWNLKKTKGDEFISTSCFVWVSPAIFLFRLLHSKSNSNSKASLIPTSELSILDISVPDRGFGLKVR